LAAAPVEFACLNKEFNDDDDNDDDGDDNNSIQFFV
jgi:hypothetical protein